MSKRKTNSSLKRRIKVTGTGKLLHYKAGRRHLLTGKSSKGMRKLRHARVVDPTNAWKLRRLLTA